MAIFNSFSYVYQRVSASTSWFCSCLESPLLQPTVSDGKIAGFCLALLWSKHLLVTWQWRITHGCFRGQESIGVYKSTRKQSKPVMVRWMSLWHFHWWKVVWSVCCGHSQGNAPLWQDNGLITGNRLREQDGRLFQGSGENPLTSYRSSFQLLSLGLFNITSKRLMSIWYSNIDRPLKIRHPHSMVPNMSFYPLHPPWKG